MPMILKSLIKNINPSMEEVVRMQFNCVVKVTDELLKNRHIPMAYRYKEYINGRVVGVYVHAKSVDRNTDLAVVGDFICFANNGKAYLLTPKQMKQVNRRKTKNTYTVAKMNKKIEEQYCSFEVSELLRENGFNEPCQQYAIDSGVSHFSNGFMYKNTDNPYGANLCTAPTHQMTLAWLRENHKIFVIPKWHYANARWGFELWEPEYSKPFLHSLDLWWDNHDYPGEWVSYDEMIDEAIKCVLTKYRYKLITK